MNENNINVNAENEEVSEPVYSSSFLMNKELFYDFCSVSYNRIKKVFLIFFCLVAFVTVENLLVGKYDIVGFGLIVSFIMFLIYFRTKSSIKISYERNLISAGKEITLNYELFEDKIVSHADGRKREFFYHQVTKLFETKNFILLHLKYNLHVTIEKNNLNANVDEVKDFLMNKCTLVKKKKFINCVNDQKWSLVFLIALIVVSVVGTTVGLILRSKNPF